MNEIISRKETEYVSRRITPKTSEIVAISCNRLGRGAAGREKYADQMQEMFQQQLLVAI